MDSDVTDACVKIGNGSGFFAAERYIVTCRHVLGERRTGDRVEYSFRGRSYPARVADIVAEPEADLALLEALQLPERHTHLKLDRVYVSEAYARLYGHPLGEPQQNNTALRIGAENEAGKISLSDAGDAGSGYSGGPICISEGDSGIAVGVYCSFREIDPDGHGAGASYMIPAREVLERWKDSYPLEELCYTVAPSSRGNPFVYNSLQTSFKDPHFYLKQLQNFVQQRERVRWWTVEGEGGSGKSRLAYELGHSLTSEWHCVLLNKAPQFRWEQLEREYHGAHRNLLLLADYAHTGVGELGAWIDHVDSQGKEVYRHKLRVLLLQRPARGGGGRQGPLLRSDANLSECRYADRNLVLEPMERLDLIGIMRSYAEKQGKKPDEKTLGELYTVLGQVDKSLKRPLFAMFITDAMLQNDDPLSWDRQAALRHFCNRELADLNKTAAGGALGDAAEAMWALATVSGGYTFPQEGLPHFVSGLYRVSALDLGRVFTEARLAEEGPEGWALQPMSPDILGEYFVLRYLEENRSRLRELLGSAAAQNESGTLDFLTRAFADHPTEPALAKACCAAGLPFLAAVSEGLASRLSKQCRDRKLREAGELLDRFHALYTEFDRSLALALPYARGLVTYLKYQADREQAFRSLERLRELYRDSGKRVQIAVPFAQGLVSYLFRQSEPEEISRAHEELCTLYRDSERDREIGALYAQGLANAFKLPLGPEMVQRSLGELRRICAEQEYEAGVAAPYAEVLGIHLFRYAGDRAAAEADLKELRRLAGLPQSGPALREYYEKGLVRFRAKFGAP